MILILIEIVILLIISVYLFRENEGFLNFIGFMGIMVGVLQLLVFGVLSYGYIASEYKADLINQEFKTSYTQEQVFWAEDVIDEIRHLKRKRIELNGDLLSGDND